MPTTTTTTTTTTPEAESSVPSSLKGKALMVECRRDIGAMDPEFLFTLQRTEQDPGTKTRLPELVASWILPGDWWFNSSLTAVASGPERIQLEGGPLTLSYGKDAETAIPRFMADFGARIVEATQKIEAAYPAREVTCIHKF